LRPRKLEKKGRGRGERELCSSRRRGRGGASRGSEKREFQPLLREKKPIRGRQITTRKKTTHQQQRRGRGKKTPEKLPISERSDWLDEKKMTKKKKKNLVRSRNIEKRPSAGKKKSAAEAPSCL